MIAVLVQMGGVPVRAMVHIEPRARRAMVQLLAQAADAQVMIDLLPADAEALAQDLVRFAALARNPGSCAENRDTIPLIPPETALQAAVSHGDTLAMLQLP